MRKIYRKTRVGIVGCGTIGSGIACSIVRELKQDCRLTALYDIEYAKSCRLQRQLSARNIAKRSLKELIRSCDLVLEAVNAPTTRPIIREVLAAHKHVIAMSTGKLLKAHDLFRLAYTNNCQLMLPSGAIAGLDAVKAASLAGIRRIELTTRKPLRGFLNNPYLSRKGIDPAKIKKETVLFKGSVDRAVRFFPQNINVAATLALAAGIKNKLKIRLVTSPKYKRNSHEIELTGPFGRIRTQTDNVPSPANPKTSYLAVLSGLQTLKQFCHKASVGT